MYKQTLLYESRLAKYSGDYVSALCSHSPVFLTEIWQTHGYSFPGKTSQTVQQRTKGHIYQVANKQHLEAQ